MFTAMADWDVSIPDFYNAICYAETGGEANPWIRTKVTPVKEGDKWVGSSTAFGPVQMTGTLVRDFYTRYPEHFKPMQEFIVKFLNQTDLFCKYGMNQGATGYNPAFDYGGTGVGFTDKDKLMYKAVAQRIMLLHKVEEALYYKNNEKALFYARVKRWCGKTEEEAPEYYAKVIYHVKMQMTPAQLFTGQGIDLLGGRRESK